jgi:hypothetical protein
MLLAQALAKARSRCRHGHLAPRSRTKLEWTQVMLDETLAALARRGLELPPPIVVADSWFSDSKLMGYVADTHQGNMRARGEIGLAHGAFG